MKLIPTVFSIVTATLSFCAAAQADFLGDFTGIYAPANWTITVSGNPAYDGSAEVVSGSAHNVIITGATGGGTTGTTPASVIDYTITLPGTPGTGFQNVSFRYSFLNPTQLNGNTAQLFDIDPHSTASPLIANLNVPNGIYQSFSTTFENGATLDFRVTSVNANLTDILQIASVPEPSTIALFAIGGAVCMASRFRKSFIR